MKHPTLQEFYITHVRFTDKNGNTIKPVLRDADIALFKMLEQAVNKGLPIRFRNGKLK